MVISLWSGPRSMSTALMYSFAQRSDTRVLDEPLYSHFLMHTGTARPCREATLAERPSAPVAALAFMAPTLEEKTGDRVLFCKHIANQAGARPEDGPWAPWWYSGVHASTGWEARPPKTPDVPDHLQDLHAACAEAYQHLLERAI